MRARMSASQARGSMPLSFAHPASTRNSSNRSASSGSASSTEVVMTGRHLCRPCEEAPFGRLPTDLACFLCARSPPLSPPSQRLGMCAFSSSKVFVQRERTPTELAVAAGVI
jgi:hypothetical protein